MAKSYETLAAGRRDACPARWRRLRGRAGRPTRGSRAPGIDDENKTAPQARDPRGRRRAGDPDPADAWSPAAPAGAASIGEFAAGKTGTTENYQDAWFVGFNDDMTVAVWVGYPEGAKPMETEYRGEPVAGGTFPAEIWHDFMLSVKKIREARSPDKEKERRDPGSDRPHRAGARARAGDGETTPKRERTGKAKRAAGARSGGRDARARARARPRAGARARRPPRLPRRAPRPAAAAAGPGRDGGPVAGEAPPARPPEQVEPLRRPWRVPQDLSRGCTRSTRR